MGNLETHEYYQRPEGAGAPDENIRIALLRMIHGVSQQLIEEAGRSLEERIQRRCEQGWRIIDERLRRMEGAIKTLEERGESRMKRLEKRVEELERQRLNSCLDENMEESMNSERHAALEQRVSSLEQSVERAMHSVLPRVETVIKQFESKGKSADPTVTRSQSLASTKLFSAHFQAHLYTSIQNSYHQKLNNLEEALMLAIKRGTVDDVRNVLDAGADINFKTEDGSSPIFMAIKIDQLDIFALLLKRGADLNVRNDLGRTCLHVATVIDRREYVNMLLAAGADPDCRDCNGWTPLHWAATVDSEAVAKELLAGGANISVRDNFGMIPLDLAGSHAVRKLLR